MMNPQFDTQPSWPDYSFMDLDALGSMQGSAFQFSSSPGDSPDICSISRFPYSGEDALFAASVSGIETLCSLGIMGEFPFDSDQEFGFFSNTHGAQTEEMVDVTEWVDALPSETVPLLNAEEGCKSPSMEQSHGTVVSSQASAVKEGTGVMSQSTTEYSNIVSPEYSTGSTTTSTHSVNDVDQSATLHLLKAHGDAMDRGLPELGEVIARRIRQIVTPVAGTPLDRFGYYLFPSSGKQSDHVRQESRKNYKAAFRALFDICPYGRLPHLVANGTIFESVPADAKVVHVVDFDMREGLQWPPFIEAVGRSGRLLRITSLRSIEDDHRDLQCWSFEETRSNLLEFARSRGVRLTVDEMDMEELSTENKRTQKKNRAGRREWMAFNCMTGLPHMGKKRHSKNTSHACDFLRLAKELLQSINSTTSGSTTGTNGIIVFGNGDGVLETGSEKAGFGRHFEGCVQHFRALFESMEWHFPSELSDARITMESLFLAPSVSSLASFDNWREIREAYVDGPPRELERWSLSKDVLLEAAEMVRGRGPYGVRIPEEKGNEMVLEWRGTPLVKVSAWR